jgi:predicted dehydrogenase
MHNAALRVGIIGAHPTRGWAASAHLPALAHLPEFEIAAVATTRMESAAETARRYDVPQAFDDWRRMVAEAVIDVVVVAVKVPFHREIVRAAATARRHVFCEWPLGLDSAEAGEMLTAVSASGVHHMVGLQSHVHPVLCHARDLIARGAIGEVISATLVASLNNWPPRLPQAETYRIDPRFGATGLTVPGGHTLDALTVCLGRLSEVSATLAAPHREATVIETGERVPIVAPTQLVVAGRLQSGAPVSLHVKADTHAPSGVRFEINGTRGDLVIASRPPVGAAPVGIQRAELVLVGAIEGGREIAPIEVPDAEAAALGDVPADAPRYTARLLRRFARGIRAGEPVQPDFAVALERHRLIEALMTSDRDGRRVLVVTP